MEIKTGDGGGSLGHIEVTPRQGPGLVDKLASTLFGPEKEQELEAG